MPPKEPTCATVSRTCSDSGARERAQKVIVIGEDLGTVPDEVREALHRFGILELSPAVFRAGSQRPIPPAGGISARRAGIGHHARSADLAGFWLGRDIEARREAGLLPDEPPISSMRPTGARKSRSCWIC